MPADGRKQDFEGRLEKNKKREEKATSTEFENIFVSFTEMDLSLVLDGWPSHSADSTFTGKTSAFHFVLVCFALVCFWLPWVLTVRAGLLWSWRAGAAPQVQRTGLLLCCPLMLRARGAQASAVTAHALSCPAACGFFIPTPGIEPMSPTLAGEFLTSGPLNHQGSPQAKLCCWIDFKKSPQCFIKAKLISKEVAVALLFLQIDFYRSLKYRYQLIVNT